MASSSLGAVPSSDNPPTVTGSTINRESEKRSPPSFSKPAQFVTITVSKAPTEQKFVVHKELICFHSPFFHAAFNGEFIEGQTQEMRMDDVDEETFGQLVHWLYTQELECIDFDDILLLGKLWILAERALIPKLQNSTIDVLWPILWGRRLTIFPKSRNMQQLLKIVFGEEREEHPVLRNLLVDHFASLGCLQLNLWAEHLPQSLLVQLTKALAKDREGSRGKHRFVLATMKKATDYYVEVPTRKKDDAAKSQRKTNNKPAISKRDWPSSLDWKLKEPTLDLDLSDSSDWNGEYCHLLSPTWNSRAPPSFPLSKKRKCFRP